MLTYLFNVVFADDIQKGLRPRRSVRNAMAHEINLYGIVQKDVRLLNNRTLTPIHIHTHFDLYSVQSYSNHGDVVLYSKWVLTRPSRRPSTECLGIRSRPTYAYDHSNPPHTHVVVFFVPLLLHFVAWWSPSWSQMLIVPPQLSLYMSLAPEQKLTYPLAGPAGPAAFNAGMQGFEAQSFRGLGVFTSTPVSFLVEPRIAHLNACTTYYVFSLTSHCLCVACSTRFRMVRASPTPRPRTPLSTWCCEN